MEYPKARPSKTTVPIPQQGSIIVLLISFSPAILIKVRAKRISKELENVLGLSSYFFQDGTP